MFDYVMMPGVPMDFINASMRAPWGFIRNNDDRYGVKVVSEEALWMYWSLNESDYASEDAFERLKAMGFIYLADLRRFLRVLDHVVQATDYYLDAMVLLLRNVQPSLALQDISVAGLKAFARAFMDDVHDYCNVWRFEDALDPKRTAYNLAVRNFRAERRWLIQNLRDGEVLDYLHPSDGSALFYGLRVAPDGSEEVLFVANMEGAPRTLTLADLPLAVAKDGWQVALKTPYLEQDIMLGAPLTLEDSQGVVLVRKKA
jgi:hypothetical protein